MNIKHCDRCSKEIIPQDPTVQYWDKSFAKNYHGAIFRVVAEGNYMNSPIDLCGYCKLYGIARLMKDNPGFHEYLDTDQLNRLEACIAHRRTK